MKYLRIFFLILLTVNTIIAQDTTDNQGYILPGLVIDGDTVPVSRIKQIVIMPPMQFDNHDDYLKYKRLVMNVKKVYPYSLLARQLYQDIVNYCDSVKDQKKIKKYIKTQEDSLTKRYTEELKSLTVTQGRILLKLVNRETGKKTYDLVKELRGSMQAFMWQQLAKMFGNDLKGEYDSDGEGKLIEKIIIMIESGQI